MGFKESVTMLFPKNKETHLMVNKNKPYLTLYSTTELFGQGVITYRQLRFVSDLSLHLHLYFKCSVNIKMLSISCVLSFSKSRHVYGNPLIVCYNNEPFDRFS